MNGLVALAAKWRASAESLDKRAEYWRVMGDASMVRHCQDLASSFVARASELESELVIAGVPAARVGR